MVVIGLIFLVIFIIVTVQRLKNFPTTNLKEDINFPSFETEDLFAPLDNGGGGEAGGGEAGSSE